MTNAYELRNHFFLEDYNTAILREDFERFFRDLTEGNDPHREKREELMRLTNQYIDGNSTKRVVDWLESMLEKRA